MTASVAAPATRPPPAPRAVVVLLAVWHKIECWIAVLAFSFIALVLMIDVLGRELYGPVMSMLGIKVGATGLFGSQKLAVFALVIGSFAGIGIATATGVHLVPRVAFKWVPASWSPHMDRIADVFTGLFLLGVTWYGVQFVIASKESGVLAAVINVSAWPIQLAIPLGFASAALRYFIFAIWPAVRPLPPEFQE
ncbi:MAG: TRAP transporter small permease subunit [Burkholderiales bacterium]|nr:TRAP transporter small permease subunit [Burkholderiales bacterium]